MFTSFKDDTLIHVFLLMPHDNPGFTAPRVPSYPVLRSFPYILTYVVNTNVALTSVGSLAPDPIQT